MNEIVNTVIAIADLYFAIDSVMEHLQDRDQVNQDLKRLSDIYISARSNQMTDAEKAELETISDRYQVQRKQAYEKYMSI